LTRTAEEREKKNSENRIHGIHRELKMGMLNWLKEEKEGGGYLKQLFGNWERKSIIMANVFLQSERY